MAQAWSAGVKAVKAAGQRNHHAEKSVLATGAGQDMISRGLAHGLCRQSRPPTCLSPSFSHAPWSCSFFLTLGGQQEDTVSPILSQPVSYLGAQVGNRMLLTVHLLLRQDSPGSWVPGPGSLPYNYDTDMMGCWSPWITCSVTRPVDLWVDVLVPYLLL